MLLGSSAGLLAEGRGSHAVALDRNRGRSRNQRCSKHSLIHSQENKRKHMPFIRTTISRCSLHRPHRFRFDIETNRFAQRHEIYNEPQRRNAAHLLCFLLVFFFFLHKLIKPTTKPKAVAQQRCTVPAVPREKWKKGAPENQRHAEGHVVMP